MRILITTNTAYWRTPYRQCMADIFSPRMHHQMKEPTGLSPSLSLSRTFAHLVSLEVLSLPLQGEERTLRYTASSREALLWRLRYNPTIKYLSLCPDRDGLLLSARVIVSLAPRRAASPLSDCARARDVQLYVHICMYIYIQIHTYTWGEREKTAGYSRSSLSLSLTCHSINVSGN